MFERLAELEKRYEEIESEMARPETLANMEEYKKFAKERAEHQRSSRPLSGLEKKERRVR